MEARHKWVMLTVTHGSVAHRFQEEKAPQAPGFPGSSLFRRKTTWVRPRVLTKMCSAIGRQQAGSVSSHPAPCPIHPPSPSMRRDDSANASPL